MKRKSALAAGAIVAALGTAAATSTVALTSAASASAGASCGGFACRGDIRHLPAPLKHRLILLDHRPSTFGPMTAFSEAPKPSNLFQYYLLDTKHFQPDVFTTTIKGIRTCLPVGSTPGSIQSILIVCENSKTISSTTRSMPIVRETGVIEVSGGICGMKRCE